MQRSSLLRQQFLHLASMRWKVRVRLNHRSRFEKQISLLIGLGKFQVGKAYMRCTRPDFPKRFA